MRTAIDVHHELNEAIGLLEWAEMYSRTASLGEIEPENAVHFRRKLDKATCLVQLIQGRLPKPTEVRDAA